MLWFNALLMATFVMLAAITLDEARAARRA
jgi:hypothetical protein